MKIGTPSDIPLLKQRRLFGLDLEMLKRVPSGLPAREDYFYFAIEKDGPYWANVAAATASSRSRADSTRS